MREFLLPFFPVHVFYLALNGITLTNIVSRDNLTKIVNSGIFLG